MKIKSITLFSNDLQSQKSFYCDTLGIDLLEESADDFTIKIGWSILTFKKSIENHNYHYCFLIPSNKMDEALDWFNNRLNIVLINNAYSYFYESWNAKSFYFYDGNDNIAECIVRYDLDNPSDIPFSVSDLLCINEIGMSSKHIQACNDRLENEMGSHFWKGNFERFATNGSQEGLFLLVNNDVKKTWIPTDVPTESAPFEAIIQTAKGYFEITFNEERLLISQNPKKNDC